MTDTSSVDGVNFYNSFNEYVLDFPAGERYRAWLTGEIKTDRPRKKNKQLREFKPKPVILIKGKGPHGSLPGGYIWARINVFKDEIYGVFVHDNDDGLMVKKFNSISEAEKGLEELKEFAPIDYMGDLKIFGFEWE